MYAGHLDLPLPLVWTVEDALPLPLPRCAACIDRMRTGSAEVAPVIERHGVEVDLAVRNNARLMWDDAAEAAKLLAHVRAKVPPRLSGLAGAAGSQPAPAAVSLRTQSAVHCALGHRRRARGRGA